MDLRRRFMTIKQIIKNCGVILGLDDVANGSGMNWDVLLRCASLVVANIAAKHVALQTTEVHSPLGHRVNLAALAQPLFSVVSVTRAGRNVSFGLHLDHIAVAPPSSPHEIGVPVTITYTYMPKIKTGAERNPFDLPPAVLEYGILAEYAFINGMTSEALVWNQKMSDIMFDAKRITGRTKTMPSAF